MNYIKKIKGNNAKLPPKANVTFSLQDKLTASFVFWE